VTAVRATEPCDLDAVTTLARIRDGSLSTEDLLRSCLDRIATREPLVHAFVVLDAEAALERARNLDRGNAPGGPLHGLPFGIKDIIDVAGMATRFGSDLPIGRMAVEDAAAIALLRQAGAIPLGKTETVEFAATGRIPPTRNPLDPARTPGGSSSGSAAAVAAGMVPFAIGTQTGGSLIRPAAYTGIHALKPSHGLVSLAGIHPHAPSLDCVGWHTRSVADLDLLASVFRLPPPRHPPAARPGEVRLAICRGPQWPHLDPEAAAAFEATVASLASAGFQLQDVALPPLFDELSAAQWTIMRTEARVSFRHWHDAWREQMHPALQALFEDETEAGSGDAPLSMTAAHQLAASCRLAFAELAAPFDALLTPATTGAAPAFEAGTGSPAMNRMWSALHVPIVALPAGKSSGGLPLGCQLIGSLHADRDLLQAAAWIDRILGG